MNHILQLIYCLMQPINLSLHMRGYIALGRTLRKGELACTCNIKNANSSDIFIDLDLPLQIQCLEIDKLFVQKVNLKLQMKPNKKQFLLNYFYKYTKFWISTGNVLRQTLDLKQQHLDLLGLIEKVQASKGLAITQFETTI